MVTTTTISKFPTGVSLTTTSTTTTSTSTVTVSSTSTVVSTTTQTAYQPASTVYPACTDDNLVTCVNGNEQISQLMVTYNFYSISGATTPRDCCIACSLDSGCGGAAFYPPSTCYGIIDDGQCNANASYARFAVASNGSPITLSNSNCGQFAIGV